MRKIPGKINKQKLEELGLKNQMIGQLVKAGKIEFNNKTIYLEDVKEKDLASPLIFIVECGDLDDLAQL